MPSGDSQKCYTDICQLKQMYLPQNWYQTNVSSPELVSWVPEPESKCEILRVTFSQLDSRRMSHDLYIPLQQLDCPTPNIWSKLLLNNMLPQKVWQNIKKMSICAQTNLKGAKWGKICCINNPLWILQHRLVGMLKEDKHGRTEHSSEKCLSSPTAETHRETIPFEVRFIK